MAAMPILNNYDWTIPALTLLCGAGGAGVATLSASDPLIANRAAVVVANALGWGANGFGMGILFVAIARKRFRITIRGALLATFWAAISCSAWRWHYAPSMSMAYYFTILSFRYFPLPAGIGAFFGCAQCGLMIGLALYCFLLVLGLFILFEGFVAI
jgi:hypothetical protein